MEEGSNKKKTIRLTITAGVAVLCVVLGISLAICGFHASQSISKKVYSVTNMNGQAQSITTDDMKKVLAIDTAYPGVTINGQDISGKSKDQVAEMFASGTSPNVKISLLVEEQNYPINPSAFKSTSTLSSVIDQAFSYNKTSTKTDEAEAILDRYQTLDQLTKTPVNFDIVYSIFRGPN